MGEAEHTAKKPVHQLRGRTRCRQCAQDQKAEPDIDRRHPGPWALESTSTSAARGLPRPRGRRPGAL